MACSSSTCNSSGCYKGYNEEERKPTTRAAVNGRNSHQNLCVKCKSNEPICCGIDRDDAKFCRDCFKTNIYGKFKQAVTYNAMITPSDKVLVAFSGGPSSRVVLQFVHEMQYRAQRNYDASKDKSLPVFGVGVAFVDESSIHSFSSQEIEKAIEDIRSIVSNLAPPSKELYVVPIENIFSSDGFDGKERLKKLLDAVSDDTGKEDLLIHLQLLLLQKVASENGYTRVVLGSCTSRIACHVISATVKGQGYSLSADIQYVDSRWEIPVVLPLRDCSAQELNTLCGLDGAVSRYWSCLMVHALASMAWYHHLLKCCRKKILLESAPLYEQLGSSLHSTSTGFQKSMTLMFLWQRVDDKRDIVSSQMDLSRRSHFVLFAIVHLINQIYHRV
ncbi:cytoplasmic tRNA 2-thiolation protein 2 isoform X2 [Durio zibethinus]|uniref:Cytoplasmic tRNA 2-thiolation protein 2 n=1 Tax=Durio zibethinus TaxID=66656 RepID=A0A6P6AP61_DURZI|nr:cytoplasmic tRNA 2-thiolation protein 2 isoform X2 [Durio zibethinus]